MLKLLPLLLLTVPALADTFQITGTYMTEYIGMQILPDHRDAPDYWLGTLTTDGVCDICTPSNGGLLSVELSLGIPVEHKRTLTLSDGIKEDPFGPRSEPVFDRSRLTLAFFFDPFNVDSFNMPGIIGFPRGPYSFNIDYPAGGFSGTYAITPADLVAPEPASIVLLSVIVAATLRKLRHQKPIA